jgi:guanidinobutyrase
VVSDFNQPLSGNEMPRFGGIASCFRLPVQANADDLDIAIVGVPLDCGTSNRAGSRYGPRQVRAESVLVRPYAMATGAAPFDSFQVADTGDVALNTYNLEKSVAIIEEHFDRLLSAGAKTLAIGGDHTITLPILRAQARRHGQLAVVHVDAHADMNDHMFGETVTHGTIFRRAIEEGLIDPDAMVQIGLRATGYAADDFDWAKGQGVQVVPAEACWYRSLAPLMEEVREQLRRRAARVPEFRYRRPRSVRGTGYGHAGARRPDRFPGPGDHSRCLRPQPDRCGPGRGVTPLRHQR